ncbi:MAG: hypothetical protein ACRDYB_12750 [Acidimicrobiales bacterium]
MDASELVAALESDPQALAAARRLLLSDALLTLPDLVAENSRQIAENSRQIAENSLQIAENTRAIAENTRAIAENTRAIAELREEIAELREEIAELRVAVTENTRAIAELRDGLAENGRQLLLVADGLSNLSGEVAGLRLELAYSAHPYGYFGSLVKRARVVTSAELADLLGDGVDAGRITQAEARDVALADLIVSGRQDGRLTYLVIEVSRTIRPWDVQRASRRAELLSRLGDSARGVVAGDHVTDTATDEAEAVGIAVVIDGRHAA